nr:c1q globular head like domain containing protein [uncultured Mediterranean phage uvMED]
MSYIGLPPKATFSSGLLDRFTSTTGTTVTLTHDIASENDIVVFVNFVKQDSTTYSVGGTGNKTLTLGGTLVSSDIVEVHYLNIVGQTVNPSANSVGSSQLTADVITGQTELASGVASTDELLISDAGTLKRVDVSLIGGANTPAFEAYLSSNQTFADVSYTKVNFNTEIFDTDNNYDNSSNFRFLPTTAGKYLVYSTLVMFAGGSTYASLAIYKNGSLYKEIDADYDNGTEAKNIISTSTAIDFNGSSDYVEIYGYLDVTSGTATFSGSQFKPCNFGAYKLIGV